MIPVTKNIVLLGATMPNLVKQSYMGDYAYFFTIDSRYHGYTRDKQLFNVYDEQTNAYTSYETPAEFLAWLESYTGGNYNPGSNTNFTETTGPQFEKGTAWKIAVGVSAMAILAFLALK